MMSDGSKHRSPQRIAYDLMPSSRFGRHQESPIGNNGAFLFTASKKPALLLECYGNTNDTLYLLSTFTCTSMNMDSDTIVVASQPRTTKRRWFWWLGVILLFLVGWQALSYVAPVVPSPVKSAAVVTDKIYEAAFSDAIIKRAGELPAEVNILVVGLDNRVASTDNHADAIHLISIRTKDSIGVTITSVPRGTEVKGYGIADDLSFMANVRALKGRPALMRAIARLTKKRKIDYYVEVTFSQVMGVLELLGYKDPATALQYLRHRKSFILGDVQRSYNQGKFIRSQIIRRADMLTGAKGDIMIRMGLGMVDTDLDLETVQAFVYLLSNANVLDEQHVSLEMRPKINYGRLDSTATPEPDEIAGVVNTLVRRVGKDIDDLGRYNPFPKLQAIVQRAAASEKNPRAVVAILQPLYSQKAWLQIQERPQRRQVRDGVEDMLIRAYTELKQPQKATEVHDYMVNERKTFSEVEREDRRFNYGRRVGGHHSTPSDAASIKRARKDNLGQQQTHVEPQTPTAPSRKEPTDENPAHTNTNNHQSDPQVIRQDAPKQDAPKQDGGKPDAPPKSKEPEVHDINSGNP